MYLLATLCLQKPDARQINDKEKFLRIQASLRLMHAEAFHIYKVAEGFNLADEYAKRARAIQAAVGERLCCMSEEDDEKVM